MKPPPTRFQPHASSLTNQHLNILAHQVADAVHARLALCCACLDEPGLRDVVSSEVFVMLRAVVGHQRIQAAHGYE